MDNFFQKAKKAYVLSFRVPNRPYFLTGVTDYQHLYRFCEIILSGIIMVLLCVDMQFLVTVVALLRLIRS